MKIKGFDTPYAKKLITQVLRGLGKTGCEIANDFEANRFKAVATRSMPDPTSDDFARAYAAWSLLRKSTLLDYGESTREAAYAAFRSTEYECHLVNNHGGTQATDSISKSIGESILFGAIRKMASVLGEFDLTEYVDACDHTGGASTQRSRATSSVKNKWSDQHDVTREAAEILQCINSANGHTTQIMTLVPGAESFTVPKDAKTDRLIFKEPQGNMFLQKGLGLMIRRRLLKEGIDLNDQSINQRLSSDLGNATVDLSNASNLISRQVVALLLQHSDPRWHFMLDAVRSHKVLVDDTYHVLEMFSGMGNGFTFELESLIFYCIAHSADLLERTNNTFTKGRVVSIYGDDIIVKKEVYDTLCIGLQYCGFRVNMLKSYASGPFRESCGAHWYHGIDVTPVYFKDRDFTQVKDWFYLVNTLSELNSVLNLNVITEVINAVTNRMKKAGILNYVPMTYGKESGIRATFDVARPTCSRKPRNAKRPWVQGYKTKVLREEPHIYRVCERGAYIRWLAQAVKRPANADSYNQRCSQHTKRIYLFSKGEALIQWRYLDELVLKEYRRGTASYAVTQGEAASSGRFSFVTVEIPSQDWL